MQEIAMKQLSTYWVLYFTQYITDAGLKLQFKQ